MSKSGISGKHTWQLVTSGGQVMYTFRTRDEAAKACGIKYSHQISAVCAGRDKSANGFVWRKGPAGHAISQGDLTEDSIRAVYDAAVLKEGGGGGAGARGGVEKPRKKANKKRPLAEVASEHDEDEGGVEKSSGKHTWQLVTSGGQVVYTFRTRDEAAKACGIKNSSQISDVCTGRQKSANGFVWQHGPARHAISQGDLTAASIRAVYDAAVLEEKGGGEAGARGGAKKPRRNASKKRSLDEVASEQGGAKVHSPAAVQKSTRNSSSRVEDRAPYPPLEQVKVDRYKILVIHIFVYYLPSALLFLF